MKIVINGAPQDCACEDLAALVASLGHAPEEIATALNREFVPVGERASTPLAEDDAVEIIVPIAGG